ncbi:MAG: CcdB family protein [Deltaproteobacteria bacterium]|nr:CcdB family protein [Deltaproteobacteria bacterium]
MQFDLHRNPRGGTYPLLLDIQADLLASLATRAVVPLTTRKRHGARVITRLNPIVEVGGTEYVLVFQELAAVPTSALGAVVGSLAGRRTELVAAIDLLFTGI